jgi:ATP-binding cassette subfamily F protein uup
LLVSHDRYFLDKLSDHLFIFEEHGRIKDFYGSYQDYQKKKWEAAKQKDKEEKELKTLKEIKNKPKKKLSFKEQKEYENLEREIEALEIEKKNLEDRLNSGITDYEELTKISQAIERIMEAMDEKTMRWMELEELKESLRKQ